MMTYLECWTEVAKALFSQALAGEPELVESSAPAAGGGFIRIRRHAPGTRRAGSRSCSTRRCSTRRCWERVWTRDELGRAAARGVRGRSGRAAGQDRQEVPVGKFEPFAEMRPEQGSRRRFNCSPATAPGRSGARRGPRATGRPGSRRPMPGGCRPQALRLPGTIDPGRARASNCCSMWNWRPPCASDAGRCRWARFSNWAPGTWCSWTGTVRDPVDLIVGDKIVARGEVVLVNGNFGLRVTEVAAPRKRLESIRCLF